MHVLRSPAPPSAAYSFAVVQVDQSRAALSASGELDLAAVSDLVGVMAEQMKAGRTFIRLDLSAVTFMDCSCLRALIDIHHGLRTMRGQLILTSVSEPVIRLLSLTHLEGTLLAVAGPASTVRQVPWPRLAPF